MNWFIPALLAPAVYTIVTFIDKYIVSKEVKDYRGMPVYGAIMGFTVGTFFWIITGFPVLSWGDALIVLTTGAISIWSAALYFEAVSLEDASQLTLLFQMSPVFTLIMAVLFLHEQITGVQLLGFLLILTASVWVSVEKTRTAFRLSRAFWLVLIVDFMWALAAILMKFTIDANSFPRVLSYESWGIGLGGLLLYSGFPSIRNAFKSSLHSVRKTALVIIFSNEAIFVVAKSITFFAYSVGPAALISIIGSSSVFFGILYGLLFSLLAPHLIKEDISTVKVGKKIAAALFLFLGLWLIYR